MPSCTIETIELGKVGRRTIEVSFDGGDLSSDAGVLLLRRADECLGLTRAVVAVFADARRAASVTHSVRTAQRRAVCRHAATLAASAAAFAETPRRGPRDGASAVGNSRARAGCVLVALALALESGRPSGEHVLNVLSRLKGEPPEEAIASAPLMLKEEPVANGDRYEQLRTLPEVHHAE